MAYTSHMPKRERGKTFLLDHIDPIRWERVKAKAKREGRSVRAVVIMLLGEYLRYGLRKD